MGRLVVEARGTASTGAGQGIAAVGNSDPLYLVVSVTDPDGVPVSGLAATDFTIDAPVVAPGGSLVDIASAGGGQHGDYSLDVVPVTYQGTQYTWALGRYIFFLAVTRGVDQARPSAPCSSIEPPSGMSACMPYTACPRGRCS